MDKRTVVLASASPRRKELLSLFLPEFLVVPSTAEETWPKQMPLKEVPLYLAQKKAADVAQAWGDALVLGADTAVFLDDSFLGKPKNSGEAFAMLRQLSGREHRVMTAVAACYQGKMHPIISETAVTFAPLTDAQIEDYIKTGEPFDKAGAYGIQGKGAKFIRSICGDYYGVMGLPVAPLYELLCRLGFAK